MTDNNAVAHFLLLGPLPADDAERESAQQRVLADVERVHEAGHQLTAILILGTSGDCDAAEETTMEAQIACAALGYQPVVVPVPGLGDRKLPASRLLTRSLTEQWARDAADLWAGQLTEDVVAPLETKVFAEAAEWHGRATADISGWHKGLLPGDGSLRLDVDGHTIGLVSCNTVFRMVADDADADLAQCFPQQLDLAAGGDFADWAMANDLTLLAAGHSGVLPDLPADAAPLVKAAGAGLDTERWQITPTGDVRHRMLRARFSSGRLEVTDTADGRRIGTAIPRATSPRPEPRVLQPAEEPYEEQPLLDAFRQNLSTGRMALVLVSGPEPAPPISLDELHRRLAEAVYGPQPPSLTYPLGETWQAAQALTAEDREHILEGLQAPQGDAPATAHRLLRAPWYRIYDFTGTNLLARARIKSPAGISLVNACVENPASKREAIEVVAMHGLPSQDGPTQDFSDAEGLPLTHPRRKWARRFRAEVLERPALFVSLSPGSAALWDILRMAGRHFGESAYPGFLVAPDGTEADRARLRPTGLQHMRLSPRDFVTTHIAPGDPSYQRGRRLLVQEFESTAQEVGVQRVDQLVAQAPEGDKTFLRGRDPNWGDIKAPLLTPRLSLFDRVLARTRLSAEGRAPIVVVTGRAGTGKTTTLMQVAYHLHQKDASHVGWVDRDVQRSSNAVAAQVRRQNLDAVFIDDIDLFKASASDFMRKLNDNGQRLVVASIRTSRGAEIPQGFPAEVVNLSCDLTDEDLGQLIKALDEYGLIGRFQGLNQQQRLDEIRKISDKGLLAAMIKAVTGSTLRQKVISEYNDLAKHGKVYQWAYAMVCLFNSEIIFRNKDISTTNLLEAIAYPDVPTHTHLAAIEGLQEMGLLLTTRGGALRCRQRTLADEVVKSALCRHAADLELVMTQLLVFYADLAGTIINDHHQDRRTMIRLLHHDVLGQLFSSPEAARRVYEAAHQMLRHDRHYWLQRAEFEIDNGDFSLADSYVQAGRGCQNGQHDRYLITCGARLRLKWSATDPTDAERLKGACDAVDDLHDVVWGPEGANAPHAFVALADDAARWLLKCNRALGYRRYVDLLDQITADVAHGEICTERNDVDAATRQFTQRLKTLRENIPGFPI